MRQKVPAHDPLCGGPPRVSGFLLDTNVISELTRPAPAPPVIGFLGEEDDLWLAALVLHEIEFGLLLLPRGRRRAALRSMVSEFVRRYEDRILPVDRRVVEGAARLRADARAHGRHIDLGDALIAGTAIAHDLCLATRNVADFEGLGVTLASPWETAQ